MGITTRSVESLSLEAVRALFLADSDVFDDTRGNVRIGPLTPDPQFGDGLIIPRQINIYAAPTALFTPGVSGVSDKSYGIVVALYGHFTTSPLPVGSPNVNDLDRLVYLRTLMSNGSDLDGTGKLVNPDSSDSVFPTERYLNTTKPEFRTIAMGTIIHISEKQKNVARMYSFIAMYETRVDNTSEERA